MNKTLIGIIIVLLVWWWIYFFMTKKPTMNNTDTNKTPAWATNTTTGSTSAKTEVNAGDTVSVRYRGTLEDGTVFDTNDEAFAKEKNMFQEGRPYQPLTFQVGAGMMIPWFDKGVVGMKVGEKKTLTLSPADAYGEAKNELIVDVPLSGFTQNNITPKAGETYNLGGNAGKVLEVNKEMVKIDFNHTLAGKKLIFEVTIVEIK